MWKNERVDYTLLAKNADADKLYCQTKHENGGQDLKHVHKRKKILFFFVFVFWENIKLAPCAFSHYPIAP